MLTKSHLPLNFFTRQYFFLIDRITLIPDASLYLEKHHVYPKSIFGPNNNVIPVSYKHHLILHYLLYRGYLLAYGLKDSRTKKMACAVGCMSDTRFDYHMKSSKLTAAVRATIRQLYTKAAEGIPWKEIRDLNGKNNGMFGKKHSEEALAKMRLTQVKSPERRLKQSLSMRGRQSLSKGRVGITNGHLQRYIPSNQDIPSGWYRGRPRHIVIKDMGSSGKTWVTNGVQEKYIAVGECIPEGFIKGRLPGRGGYNGRRATS